MVCHHYRRREERSFPDEKYRPLRFERVSVGPVRERFYCYCRVADQVPGGCPRNSTFPDIASVPGFPVKLIFNVCIWPSSLTSCGDKTPVSATVPRSHFASALRLFPSLFTFNGAITGPFGVSTFSTHSPLMSL